MTCLNFTGILVLLGAGWKKRDTVRAKIATLDKIELRLEQACIKMDQMCRDIAGMTRAKSS